MSDTTTLDGGCTCRAVRYRLTSGPLYVHCCHCRWCQRETGAAFALNALIEAERVQMLDGQVEVIDTPSLSGKGQRIARCPTCRVALWSNYGGGPPHPNRGWASGDTIRFIRVGTLDQPDRLPPDIHIYTMSKQPWVILPAGANAVNEFYRFADHWPQESLDRLADLRARRSQQQQQQQ